MFGREEKVFFKIFWCICLPKMKKTLTLCDLLTVTLCDLLTVTLCDLLTASDRIILARFCIKAYAELT